MASGTNIGNLFLTLGLDASSLHRGLEEARQKSEKFGADIQRNLFLNPKVDHTELTKLNEHLDLKQKHFDDVQKYMGKNPLSPKTDTKQVDRLAKDAERAYNNIQKLARFSNANTIGLTASTSGTDDYSRSLDGILQQLQLNNAELQKTISLQREIGQEQSSIESLQTPISQQPNEISSSEPNATDLEKTIAKSIQSGFKKGIRSADKGIGGDIAGMIGGLITAPVKIAAGTVGGVLTGLGQGLSLSITQELSKNLGKGLSSALERSLSEAIGGTELFGDKAGEFLIKGLTSTVAKGFDQLPQLAADAVNKIGEKLDLPAGVSRKIGNELKRGLKEDLETVKKKAGEAGQAVRGVVGEDAIAEESLVMKSRSRSRSQARRPIVQDAAMEEWRSSIRAESNLQKMIDLQLKTANQELPKVREKYRAIKKEVQDLEKEISRMQSRGAAPDQIADKRKELQEKKVELESAAGKRADVQQTARAGSLRSRVTTGKARLDEMELRRDDLIKKKNQGPLSSAETQELDDLTSETVELREKLKILEGRVSVFTKPLERAKQRKEQAQAKVQQLRESAPTSGLPKNYVEMVKRASPGISEERIPQLIVDEAHLRDRNADALYQVARNAIVVNRKMYQAITQGKLSEQQHLDLNEEIFHGKDFDFGSFQGYEARANNQVLGQKVQATPEELAKFAPELGLYSSEKRGYELNAKVQAYRAQQAAQSGMGRASLQDQFFQTASLRFTEGSSRKRIKDSFVADIKKAGELLGKDVSGFLANVEDDYQTVVRNIDAAIERTSAKVATGEATDEDFKQLEQSILKQFSTIDALNKTLAQGSRQLVDQGKKMAAEQKSAKEAEQTVRQQKRAGLTGAIATGEMKLGAPEDDPYFGVMRDPSRINNQLKRQALEQAKNATALSTAVATPPAARQRGFNVEIDMDAARGAAQKAGQIARSTIETAKNVAGSAPVRAIVSAGGNLAKGLGVAAKTSYKLAEGVEALALDVIPMGRSIKAVGKNVVLPGVAFTAASHLIPGGHVAAEALTSLAQSGVSPLAHGAAGSMIDAASGAIGHLPHALGIQSTVAGAINGAIESATSAVGSAVAQAGAAVFGGKLMTTAASRSLAPLAPQAKQPLNALPPAVEQPKAALRLPMAEIKQAEALTVEIAPKVEQAKSALTVSSQSPRPAAAIKQAQEKAKQVAQQANQVGQQVGQAVGAAMDAAEQAVQQAKKISKNFWDTHKALKTAIESGDLTNAERYLKIIKDNAARAKADIKSYGQSLGEGLKEGNIGSRLANQQSQISRTVNSADREVAKLRKMKARDIPTNAIDVSSTGELESEKINVEAVAGWAKQQLPDLAINAVGFAASKALQSHGIIPEMGGDLMGALAARQAYNVGKVGVGVVRDLRQEEAFQAANAMKKLSMVVNELSSRLQSEGVQKALGHELTGDLAGWAIGNASSMAMNAIPGLGGIPLKGAGVAMATVPQLVKAREAIQSRLSPSTSAIATPDGELEAEKLNLEKLSGVKGMTAEERQELEALNKLIDEALLAADQFDKTFTRSFKEADRQFEESVKGVNEAIENIGKIDEPVEEAKQSMGGLPRILGLVAKGFVAFQAISFFAPMIMGAAGAASQAALEFERFERVINFTSGGSTGGAKAIADIRTQANLLGTDLKAAMMGYAQFSAATRDTPLEGEATKQTFKGFSQGMGAQGLDSQRQELVFTGLSQVASKGVVSMEELRQQIGESLPGAMQIAARSMNMTVQEFNNLVASGQLLSDNFLPKFAQQMSAESSIGVAGAANSAQASINRLNNQMYELQVTAGKGILPVQKVGSDAIAAALQLINEHGKEVMTVLAALAALMTGQMIQAIVAVAGRLNLIPAGFQLTKATMMGALTSFGAFAAQLGAISLAFMVAQRAMEMFSDKGGTVRQAADANRKSLEELKKTLDSMQGKEKSTPDKPKGYAGLFSSDDERKALLDQMQGNMYAQGEMKDKKKAAGDLLNTSKESMDVARGIMSGDTVTKLTQVDKSIESNQLQQRALRISDPKDVQGINALKEAEEKLLKQREELYPAVGQGSAILAQSIESVKSQIDELDGKPEYLEQVTQLKSRLKELEGLQAEFNNKINTGADVLTRFGREWQKIVDAMEDANTAIDRMTVRSTAAISKAQSSGELTPGGAEGSKALASQEALSRKFAENRKAAAQLNAELQGLGADEVMGALGVTKDTGKAQLKTLTDKVQGPKEKKVLESLSQLQDLEAQAEQFDSELSGSIAQLNEQMFQSSKQVADFFRGIARQSEELGYTLQQMDIESTMNGVKARIKTAMTGFEDNFVSQFADSMVSVLEMASQKSQNMNNAMQQIQQRLNQVQDVQLQAGDMQRGLVGPGAFQGLDQPVAASGVKASAVVQQALSMAGKEFAPGMVEQCANFVRDTLKKAGVEVGVTKQALDGLETGAALASSFFGKDIGQIIKDKKDVQPGDVLAFGGTYGGYSKDTITHVGLAVGNGQMVDRSTSSKPVSKRSIDTFEGPNSGFLYAVRPYAYSGGDQARLNPQNNIIPGPKAMPMSGEGGTGTFARQFLGIKSNADLYRLAVTAITEGLASDVQSQLDTAIAMGNRVQSGKFGSTASQIVSAPGQFEAWTRFGLQGVNDRNSAVAALNKNGYNGAATLDKFLDALNNPQLLANSVAHVRGATDYRGESPQTVKHATDYQRKRGDNFYLPGGDSSASVSAAEAKRLQQQGIALLQKGGNLPMLPTTGMTMAGMGQAQSLQGNYDANTAQIGQAVAMSQQDFEKYRTGLLSQVGSQNTLLDAQMRAEIAKSLKAYTRATQDEERKQLEETRKRQDVEFEAENPEDTPQKAQKKRVVDLQRQEEDATFTAKRVREDAQSLVEANRNALKAAKELQSKGLPVDDYVKGLESSLPTLEKNLKQAQENEAAIRGNYAKLTENELKKQAIEEARLRLDAAKRIADVEGEAMQLRLQKMQREGDPIGSLNLQMQMQVGAQNIDFEQKMQEVEDLKREGKLTGDEYIRLKGAIEEVNQGKLDNIIAETKRVRDELVFNSKTQLFQSRSNLASGITESYTQYGLDSQAKEIQKAQLIAQQGLDFETQIKQIDDAVRSLNMLPDAAAKAKENLTQLNQVKLDNIQRQFDPWQEALTGTKSAFEGFLTDAISGSKSIGDAFKDMVKGIIGQLSSMASKLITDQIFGFLTGKTNKKAKEDATKLFSPDALKVSTPELANPTDPQLQIAQGGQQFVSLTSEAGNIIIQAAQQFAQMVNGGQMGLNGQLPGMEGFSFGGFTQMPDMGGAIGSFGGDSLLSTFTQAADTASFKIMDGVKLAGNFLADSGGLTSDNLLGGLQGGLPNILNTAFSAIGGLLGGGGGGGGGGGILGIASSILGGGGGGGGMASGLLGGITSLFGFNSGYIPPNFAEGRIPHPRAIEKAIKRERSQGGRKPFVAVINEDEVVLTKRQAERFSKSQDRDYVLGDRVPNYAEGKNPVAGRSFERRTERSNINAPVSVTINGGSAENTDIQGFRRVLDGRIREIIQQERRQGGSLNR